MLYGLCGSKLHQSASGPRPRIAGSPCRMHHFGSCVRLVASRSDITMRHGSLRLRTFCLRHATIRSTSGIWSLQSRNTSGVQACRSSSVPSRSPASARPMGIIAATATHTALATGHAAKLPRRCLFGPQLITIDFLCFARYVRPGSKSGAAAATFKPWPPIAGEPVSVRSRAARAIWLLPGTAMRSMPAAHFASTKTARECGRSEQQAQTGRHTTRPDVGADEPGCGE